MDRYIIDSGERIHLLKSLRAPEDATGKGNITKRVSTSDSSKCDTSKKDLGAVLRPMITSFVSDVGYTAPPPGPTESFWAAMKEYADKTGVDYTEGTHAWKCFRVGLSYSSYCFPNHPRDVQVYVGVYSWLGLLLDDETVKAPDDFSAFVERFAAGEKQPTPLLEGWAELMRWTFKLWDPVVANFIVSSSLNFVNANVLETRKEFKGLKRTRDGGDSWPWFLRDKDGVAEAYAWFTFPKSMYPDMSKYLEMIPDLSSYIAQTNDILSFYKEERSGDKDNYIHSRGWYQKKAAFTVLGEIMDEQRACVRRMRIVLADREPYLQAVNEHITGYVAFHQLNDRYRLWEVGLGTVWERS